MSATVRLPPSGAGAKRRPSVISCSRSGALGAPGAQHQVAVQIAGRDVVARAGVGERDDQVASPSRQVSRRSGARDHRRRRGRRGSGAPALRRRGR